MIWLKRRLTIVASLCHCEGAYRPNQSLAVGLLRGFAPRNDNLAEPRDDNPCVSSGSP